MFEPPKLEFVQKRESVFPTNSAANFPKIPSKKYTTGVCTWRYVYFFWVKRSRVMSFISFRKKKFIEKFRSIEFYQLWLRTHKKSKIPVARTGSGSAILVLKMPPGWCGKSVRFFEKKKFFLGFKHPDFPTGHPRQYYPGLLVLNFSNQAGWGVFTRVWPNPIRSSEL